MLNSINLILKDFQKNDNLINITKFENDYEFSCTCGKEFCYHLDYVINTISNDINKKKSKKCLIIKGFDKLESININMNDNNNSLHKISIQYQNDSFKLNCSCLSEKCFYARYAVIDLITNYLKKKETINNLENDLFLLKKIEEDLSNLII